MFKHMPSEATFNNKTKPKCTTHTLWFHTLGERVQAHALPNAFDGIELENRTEFAPRIGPLAVGPRCTVLKTREKGFVGDGIGSLSGMSVTLTNASLVWSDSGTAVATPDLANRLTLVLSVDGHGDITVVVDGIGSQSAKVVRHTGVTLGHGNSCYRKWRYTVEVASLAINEAKRDVVEMELQYVLYEHCP